MNEFINSTKPESCFAIEYTYSQYYLPGSPEILLLALVALGWREKRLTVCAGVAESTQWLRHSLRRVNSVSDLIAVIREHHVAWVDLQGPLLLKPVYVAKPWGREIWYTGIESRGQSEIVSETGQVALPWLLSLAPQFLIGETRSQVTLLKILDPLPEEVYGDLYFEMHEQKQEVYVVTHVDRDAWPDGVGGIRFGFDPGKRRHYADDKKFRAAYMAAVAAYETVRREIDCIFDRQRDDCGIAADEPLPVATVKQWQQNLPAVLRERELELRKEMESYTAMRPLRVGDVVKVPCYTPHSLQHGVRTVEFQTPVYERKILSFAQKVLTQAHWDTAEVINKLDLDTPAQSPLIKLQDQPGVQVERVVDFSDFEVRRLSLAGGATFVLEETSSYLLVMSIRGVARVKNPLSPPLELAAEQAAIVPAGSSQTELENNSNETVTVLLSIPRKTTGISQ